MQRQRIQNFASAALYKPIDWIFHIKLVYMTNSKWQYCIVAEHTLQGSDTRVRTQKHLVGFLGYTHLKNPPKKNPHFYFNIILVYTLYATNNAIFYCFKAFKASIYWLFVLFSRPQR